MATKSFEFQGQRIPLFEDSNRWTLGETRAVERWLGYNLNELLSQEQTMAVVVVSIRRARPDMRMAAVLEAVEGMEQGVLVAMAEEAQAAEAAEEAARQAAEGEVAGGGPGPSVAAVEDVPVEGGPGIELSPTLTP